MGGGVSGLLTLRSVLRAGLDAFLLEAEPQLGGRLWDLVRRGHGAHELGPWQQWTLPGYPWPHALRPQGEAATASTVVDYLQAFASDCGLQEHVRCGAAVQGLSQLADGRWLVALRDAAAEGHSDSPSATGEPAAVRLLTASFVVVAAGPFAEPFVPDLTGRSSGFRGHQRHAGLVFPAGSVRGRAASAGAKARPAGEGTRRGAVPARAAGEAASPLTPCSASLFAGKGAGSCGSGC